MCPRKRSSRSSRSPSEPALEIGVYLHLPFCLSKCAYCDFCSLPLEWAGGLPAARRYLDSLAVELDLRAASHEFHRAPAVSVYLGGGTPTLLPAEWVAHIVERVRLRFPVAAEAEITVEANPGTLDQAKAARLLEAGVNRISLGVQSFSDAVLATLGRAHTAADAGAAIAAARAAGVQNLGLDIICGIPGQSLDDWRQTLESAVAARPEHISAYGLSLEPDTPLAARVADGSLPAPEDDVYADMYLAAADMLTAAGYEHYEISNFALPGRQCEHNRRYWTDAEYLGLGVAAHSHRGGLRWNNSDDLKVYTEWLERGLLPTVRAETLSARQRVGEALMLGLRLAEGVSEQEVEERCGLLPREVLGDQIEQLCEEGLLIAVDGRLSIPRDKWLISNEVLSRLVP